MKKAVPLVLLIAGCTHDPIVDMRGVDEQQYRQDLAECREYAEQVKTGEEAVKRGAIGAVVGGAVGAAIGDGELAKRTAGVGAVSGTTGGATRAERRKDRVVYNCLRGRGYRILG